MNAPLSYMGTKRELAPRIATKVAEAKAGPFLDLFAGMAAVGRAVGTARQLWLNDVQLFACKVNSVSFVSPTSARVTKRAIADVRKAFLANSVRLEELLHLQLELERTSLAEGTLELVQRVSASLLDMCSDQGVVERAAARTGATHPYRLFSYTYAGGFFGLAQCVELDSIRFAIDVTRTNGQISEEVSDRMLASLCRAATICANSTGHFAQYLTPKVDTIARQLRTRRRSVWDAWVLSLNDLAPAGNSAWRRKNRIFNQDASKLLSELKENEEKPSVIYADPPYTSDQYSRYYHLLETLLLYDYPDISGKGQYRPDRFASPFCSKRQVESAFEDLATTAAALGSTLIVSYPTNGLLEETGVSLIDILKKSYPTIRDPIVVAHRHSSLGASKGKEKIEALERIFIAEPV